MSNLAQAFLSGRFVVGFLIGAVAMGLGMIWIDIKNEGKK